jgi:hypothetical protein
MIGTPQNDSPPALFSKRKPHPTRERGAGLHTDLDSPTPAKTTEEGGGA